MTAHPIHATPHRRAFLRAVASDRSRIVTYVGDRAYDNVANIKVTERLREAFQSGWIEPVPDEDLWPNAEPRTRVIYYRLTPAGRRIIEEKK